MDDYSYEKLAFKRGTLQSKTGRNLQAAILKKTRAKSPKMARFLDVNKSSTYQKIEPKIRPITNRYPAAPEAWVAGNVVGVGLPGSGTVGIGMYAATVEAKIVAKKIGKRMKALKRMRRMQKQGAEVTTVPRTDMKAQLSIVGMPRGLKFITTPEESMKPSSYYVSPAKITR